MCIARLPKSLTFSDMSRMWSCRRARLSSSAAKLPKELFLGDLEFPQAGFVFVVSIDKMHDDPPLGWVKYTKRNVMLTLEVRDRRWPASAVSHLHLAITR
jgi:hypothetical protein